MSGPLVDPRFPGRLKQLRTYRRMPLRELARRTNFGKSYLHQFETGARTPSREHVARLDDALGAGGELVALVTDPGPVGYAISHPGSADAAAADQLADALADSRRTEDEVGAAPMLTVASTRLATVESLARQARAPVRPKLIRVAAQWAQWGGWLHLAIARHRRAGVWLDRALEWAIEADDRELIATVLSFKAYGAGLVNEPGAMVGLTEAALRDPDVYVGQRAYDRFQLARGHALLGERRPAVEELAAAGDLAAEAAEFTGDQPPWHYYRSAAHFRLEAGLVEVELGRHHRAAELLRTGIDGLPEDMRDADWTKTYRAALIDICPDVRM